MQLFWMLHDMPNKQYLTVGHVDKKYPIIFCNINLFIIIIIHKPFHIILKGPCTKFEVEHMLNQPKCIKKWHKFHFKFRAGSL